jgi:hypothetical protein
VRDRKFHEDFPVTSLLLLFNIAFFFLETIGTLKKLGDMSEPDIMVPIDPVVTHFLGSISHADLARESTGGSCRRRFSTRTPSTSSSTWSSSSTWEGSASRS